MKSAGSEGRRGGKNLPALKIHEDGQATRREADLRTEENVGVLLLEQARRSSSSQVTNFLLRASVSYPWLLPAVEGFGSCRAVDVGEVTKPVNLAELKESGDLHPSDLRVAPAIQINSMRLIEGLDVAPHVLLHESPHAHQLEVGVKHRHVRVLGDVRVPKETEEETFAVSCSCSCSWALPCFKAGGRCIFHVLEVKAPQSSRLARPVLSCLSVPIGDVPLLGILEDIEERGRKERVCVQPHEHLQLSHSCMLEDSSHPEP
mmetsp:Transcript_5425/g.19081  ORF Transcript_5425/g.19081 Transcript_5425/m.19081 type:complete len:261 (-) Transcript_5425:570-1352(-)